MCLVQGAGKCDSGGPPIPVIDLQEHMLFAEVLETIECCETCMLDSAADVNVNSLDGSNHSHRHPACGLTVCWIEH